MDLSISKRFHFQGIPPGGRVFFTYVCDVQQKINAVVAAAASIYKRPPVCWSVAVCGGGEKPGEGNDFAKRVANEVPGIVSNL